MHHLAGWSAHPAGFAPVAVADPTPERLEVGRVTAGLAPTDAYADYRDVLARESFVLPWREVLWALRRLEARGVARGTMDRVRGAVKLQY